MSDGMNRWQGIGNLGADGELRVTPSGQSVLKLRLACTESYLDRNNTRQERTEWVNCTVWAKRAEGLAKILSKGDRIYVEGRLQTTMSEKDGQKPATKELRAQMSAAGATKKGSYPKYELVNAKKPRVPRRKREKLPETTGPEAA